MCLHRHEKNDQRVTGREGTKRRVRVIARSEETVRVRDKRGKPRRKKGEGEDGEKEPSVSGCHDLW